MGRRRTVAEALCGYVTPDDREALRIGEAPRGCWGYRVSLSCQVSISVQPRRKPLPERLRALPAPCFHPLADTKTRIY